MGAISAVDIRLVEPVPIDDDFCTRLALVEDVGLGARFVLVSNQTCYETGTTIWAVKRKIILPFAAIGEGVELAARFMTRRALGRLRVV